jgi:prokaryotic ubiquitin-like protein Pup
VRAVARIGLRQRTSASAEDLMATKDSGGQRHTTRRGQEEEDDLGQGTEEGKERREKLTDDVDAILDEIDEVLEENAEEFVRSYVQKGGE